MTDVYTGPAPVEDVSLTGFSQLDKIYENSPISREDMAFFGRYALRNTAILATPTEVTRRGQVLTNPSQIETHTREVDGEMISDSFAYFRQEPPTLHLGNTLSVPYLIRDDSEGRPHLTKFIDAAILEGEDPRISKGVRIKGLLGRIHKGWLVSTTVATPDPVNPTDVESIKQVFYWGEDLAKLQPITELPDTKNTTLHPVAADRYDTRIDVFARPKPDISYLRLPDITGLTKELIDSAGINLTEGFLPTGIHCGPNAVKAAGPNHRELDIHEAYLEPIEDDGDEKIAPHYRLGRYGFELPRDGLAAGRLIPLGILATRSQFPDAVAKSPENGVGDYWDILYGSIGKVRPVRIGQRAGRMVVGASDSQVGIADIVRIA